MKYIRTKSGYIFDKENLDMTFHGSQEEYNFWKQYLRAEHLNQHHFLADKILKEADTIEELCDVFVIIDEDNEPNIKQGRDIHHCRRIWAINNCLIYGAIWTDKGLIYVAKMNDKGELELL